MGLLQESAAVLFVLALLCGALWLLKAKPRFHVGGFRQKGEAPLASVGRLSLTTHHSLHLVRAGDRLFMLGVSPTQMTLIRELTPERETLPRAAG